MKIKKYIMPMFIILIVVLFSYYIKNNTDIIDNLKLVSVSTILFLSILITISLYVNGITFYLLGTIFNLNIKKHFYLSNAASFLNLITPFRGGAGFRAWYMKKKYNFEYSYFISSLFGTYVIVFFIAAFLALINFIYLYFYYGIWNTLVFVLFLGIFFIFGLIIIYGGSLKIKNNNENKFIKKINKVILGWEIISKDKILVLQLGILQFINIVISTLILYLLFLDIGIDITISKVFYISIISILSIFINITPGSIGITESFYILSASIINIPIGIMVTIALLKRGIETIVLLVLGIWSKYFLIKELKNEKPPK